MVSKKFNLSAEPMLVQNTIFLGYLKENPFENVVC